MSCVSSPFNTHSGPPGLFTELLFDERTGWSRGDGSSADLARAAADAGALGALGEDGLCALTVSEGGVVGGGAGGGVGFAAAFC